MTTNGKVRCEMLCISKKGGQQVMIYWGLKCIPHAYRTALREAVEAEKEAIGK